LAVGRFPADTGADGRATPQRLLAFPTLTARASVGRQFTGDSAGGALELGAQATAFTGLAGDAYVQFPRRLAPALDLGAGIMYSFPLPHGPLLYAQAGGRLGGRYLFTSQAIGWLGAHGAGSLRLTTWQPTFGLEWTTSDGLRRFAFATAGVKINGTNCLTHDSVCRVLTPNALLALGLAMTPMFRFGR
jgi:hypothetical protein